MLIAALAETVPTGEPASGSFALLTAFALVALAASFLCSLSEAAILSLPRSAAHQLARSGTWVGVTIERMKREIERPLNAILTLNTVANTIGAVGVGAQASLLFSSAAVGIASGAMTYLVLVFGELIPKKIGATYCRPLAPLVAVMITAMQVITVPLVVLARPLTAIADLLLKRFANNAPSSVSRETLGVIAEIGSREGALTDAESAIVSNLMQLSEVRVHAVMTPRTRVFMLQEDTPVAEAMSQDRFTGYTRIPLFGRDHDEMTGVVIKGNLYEAFARGEAHRRVGDFRRRLHAVPEQATLLHVLDLFGRLGHHIFLVVDEFGGTAGVITLEDVLESIIGREIVDETDETPDLREPPAQTG